MNDATGSGMRLDEDVSNLVYHCRVNVSRYDDQDRERFFRQLFEELESLRAELAPHITKPE